MNSIEDEIRTLLRSKVFQVPVRDEPPPVVLRRTRTLRGVNAVGAASAAAAVVLGVVLAVQSLGAQRTVAPTGPVPWTPASPESEIDTPEPAGDAPFCRAEDLIFSATPAELIFAPRTSDTRCLLDVKDGLRVQLIDRGGVKPSFDAVIEGNVPSIVVEKQPRKTILFMLRIGKCGEATLPETVRVELPRGGGALEADLEFSGSSCTNGKAFFNIHGVGTLDPPSGPLAASLSGLVTSMTAPGSIEPGETLAFAVTFKNPTAEAIALDPCPNYSMDLSDGKDVDPDVSSAFQLNCGGAGGLVPAGEQVTFEMRFEVPADLTPGEWTFTWSLQSRYGHVPLSRHSRIIQAI